MAYAGIESFGELARLIDQDGLGERTLRKLADDRDEKTAQRRDLVAISDVTGLPYEFFTLENEALVRALTGGGSGLDDRVSQLEQALQATESRFQEALGRVYAAVSQETDQGLQKGSLPGSEDRDAKESRGASS